MNEELLPIFKDESLAIKYLIDKEIILETIKCYKCKSILGIDYKEQSYRCNRKSCNKKVSIYKNTIFENKNVSINVILQIAYFYLSKLPITSLIEFTGCSSRTITEWTLIVREICSESIKKEDQKIGGEKIIVEIDETKLGKRKYHRGHHVDGVWCICGIERTGEKRSFVVPVENRNAQTIKAIIENYVEPGSVIYTDCWRAYNEPCNELGFEHLTVNHSIGFKNPETGVHTNTVEGFNNGLKTSIKPRNRNSKGICEHVGFFIFCRKNKKNKWNAFLNALKI